MDLIFRLPGPWGAGKGSNLQPTEVDNNFWELAEAILDLQSNPALPVGIESINVSGTQMTITLTDGTVMGPFTLPVLTFRWRGEWVPGAVYAELDVFSVFDTGIFMALLDHTSGATFDPDITAGDPPAAALQQLFGSTDARLSSLSDVVLTGDPAPESGDVLVWEDDAWYNVPLGSMAYQHSSAVDITGGTITGMPAPTNPDDVATKGYVDSLPAGATTPDATIMANIIGFVAPAIPNTLSDILDYILATTVRGTLVYRGGPGWIALPPSSIPAQFLMSNGPGFDPEWHAGTTAGITQLYPGAGISLGGGSIVDTGTISLAEIADDTLLANVSGASAAPTATTLSALLDGILGTARGTIITRTIAGWVGLAAGTAGYYLKTQGAGADAMWDAPAGTGTVTSISAGTGISTGGSPITGTGTVALATIADASVLANTSGSAAAPVPTTVTLLLDKGLGTTQGAVMYRSATTWVMLAPGTSGQFLATGGAAANPSWQNAPTTGAAVPTGRIISNISGSSATPSGNTLTNILDAVISSARGTLLYRTNSGWTGLAPGTSGQVLQTGGASGDPSWTAAPGATAIANNRVMANISGGSAAPAANTLSGIFDSILGSTRGMIIYRDNSGWRTLAAGTAGQLLRSGGTTADPSWFTATPGSGISELTGDVTAGPGTGAQVATLASTAVTPGSYTSANITVDTKGRITAAANGAGGGGLSAINNNELLANISGSSAAPIGNTLSALVDSAIGNTRGTILYRGTSAWSALTPGTAGHTLTTGGAGADPSWAAGASLPSGAANDQLVYVSGAWSAQRPKYVVSTYVPSTMTAAQNLLYHRLTKAVTLPANLGAYLGHATVAGGGVAATGSTAITVEKATAAAPTTFSTVATLTVAASSTNATLSTQAAISFAQGDVLRVRGPATADATFAEFHLSLVGYET